MESLVVIVIKLLEMCKIAAINNPLGVNIPLKNQTKKKPLNEIHIWW